MSEVTRKSFSMQRELHNADRQFERNMEFAEIEAANARAAALADGASEADADARADAAFETWATHAARALEASIQRIKAAIPCALLLVVGLLFAARADAALIRHNDPALPPGSTAYNLTTDTETGLSWLNPRAVSGSFDYVSGVLLNAPQFAGYRYATNAEVAAFFGHLGLPTPSQPVGGTATVPGHDAYNRAAAYFGVSNSYEPRYAYTYGITSQSIGTLHHALALASRVEYVNPIYPLGLTRETTTAVGLVTDAVANNKTAPGHWLVTTHAVPEPSAATLVAVLLLVAGGALIFRDPVFNRFKEPQMEEPPMSDAEFLTNIFAAGQLLAIDATGQLGLNLDFIRRITLGKIDVDNAEPDSLVSVDAIIPALRKAKTAKPCNCGSPRCAKNRAQMVLVCERVADALEFARDDYARRVSNN